MKRQIQLTPLEQKRLAEYIAKHEGKGILTLRETLLLGMGYILEIEDEDGNTTYITDEDSF